jgi:hypothetical protein
MYIEQPTGNHESEDQMELGILGTGQAAMTLADVWGKTHAIIRSGRDSDG